MTQHPMDARRARWLVASLTLAAFALHTADLAGRSMWLDEGYTLIRLFDSWRNLLGNVVVVNGVYTIDTNPQVYFALLKSWMLLAGRGEWALKALSAFGAVAFVPLCAALARRFYGARAGAIAALLAALSPLLAWYAAELRMYSLVVCLAAASLLALERALRLRTLAAGLLWLLPTALALATHYSFAGWVLTQAGLLAWALWRQRLALPRALVLTLAAAGALVAAVLAIVLDAPGLLARLLSGQEYAYGYKPLADVVGSMASGILFGVNRPDPSTGVLSWLFFLMWLIAAFFMARRRVEPVLHVVAPVLAWWAVSWVKPNFAGARHLMLILPAVLAILAGAVACALNRPRAQPPAALLLIGLCAAHGYGLAHVYLRTSEWQDDWRSAARHIRAQWMPGDIALANAGTPVEVLRSYLGDVPVSIRSTVPISDPAAADAALRGARRVWYFNTGGADLEPGNAPEWLRRLPVIDRARFASRTNTIELALLARELVVDSLPAEARAAPGIDSQASTLAGFAIGPPNRHGPRPNVRVTVWWRRGERASDLALRMRLRSGERVWLDAPLALKPADSAPGWSTGRLLQLDHWVDVPLGLPPLPYQIDVIASDAAGAEVQTLTQPVDAALLACCIRQLDWTPSAGPSPDAFAFEYRQPPMTADWRVLGNAQVAADYAAMARPDDTVVVGLTWRMPRTPDAPLECQLRIEDVLGSIAGSGRCEDPLPGPLLRDWPPGQALRSMAPLRIAPGARSGWYRVMLTRQSGAQAETAQLGWIELREHDLAPPSPPQHAADARVGDFTLLGYSTEAPFARGAMTIARTHWRVARAPVRDGVLFLHVIGPDGQPVAQDDNPPEGGARSTMSYRPGAGIDQAHRITLPANAPAGEYTLYAGVYDRDSFERWPAAQNGAPARDNLVLLGRFMLP